jgi:hypothetical protein
MMLQCDYEAVPGFTDHDYSMADRRLFMAVIVRAAADAGIYEGTEETADKIIYRDESRAWIMSDSQEEHSFKWFAASAMYTRRESTALIEKLRKEIRWVAAGNAPRIPAGRLKHRHVRRNGKTGGGGVRRSPNSVTRRKKTRESEGSTERIGLHDCAKLNQADWRALKDAANQRRKLLRSNKRVPKQVGFGF